MRPAAAPFSRRPSTLVNQRDLHQLIDECNVSLQADPTCLHTLAVRGHACMKAKLWDLAIRDFSHILHCRPDDIHGRFSRGMAFFKTGHIESAHMDFSRVLELNPHHVMARYARAGCYNTEGEFHEAILDYTIALEHDEKEHESAFRIEKLHRVGISTRASAEKSGSVRHQPDTQHNRPQPAVAASAAQSLDQQQSTTASHPISHAAAQSHAPVLNAHGGIHREPTIETKSSRLTKATEASLQPPQSVQSLSPLQSSGTAQPPSRAPRRIVQVRVNLSEFAASSCKSTNEPPLTETTSTPTMLSNQQPVVQRQAPPAQQLPATIAAARRTPEPETRPSQQVQITPAARIPSASTTTGCSAAPDAPPLPLQVQQLRPQPRVIRKVTVTL